jgi:hypothetical protein
MRPIGKVKDKAPAAYMLEPHFLDATSVALMADATENTSNDEAAEVYERFLQKRQTVLIEEIRRACGITTVSAEPVEELEPDEPLLRGSALLGLKQTAKQTAIISRRNRDYC